MKVVKNLLAEVVKISIGLPGNNSLSGNPIPSVMTVETKKRMGRNGQPAIDRERDFA
jgi:hypothetical protein